MKNIPNSNIILFIFRIGIVTLTLFTIIAGWVMSAIISGNPISWLIGFKYYTTQTNILVTIWLILAIIWFYKPESLNKISGRLKGAITLYITTTFVFFAILLQIFYHPTGFAAFSNFILHYFTPIAFIVDWVLTETEIRYKWNYLLSWMMYPLGYLVFSLVHGLITGDYLYPFLNLIELGILGYVISVSLIVGAGVGMGCIYIAINRFRTKKLLSKEQELVVE